MRPLLAWAADILLGPRCPITGCRHRARGWRTLATHLDGHLDTHPGTPR